MNLIAVTMLTVAAAAAPIEGAAKEPTLDLLPIEQNVIAKTNRQRTRYGLPPLEVDVQLMNSARRHAAWMARRSVLRHTVAAVAENIAMGQSSSREAVQDWMSSPGHRANILNSSHSRIGVGAYRGVDGRIYWCQQFLW